MISFIDSYLAMRKLLPLSLYFLDRRIWTLWLLQAPGKASWSKTCKALLQTVKSWTVGTQQCHREVRWRRGAESCHLWRKYSLSAYMSYLYFTGTGYTHQEVAFSLDLWQQKMKDKAELESSLMQVMVYSMATSHSSLSDTFSFTTVSIPIETAHSSTKILKPNLHH